MDKAAPLDNKPNISPSWNVTKKPVQGRLESDKMGDPSRPKLVLTILANFYEDSKLPFLLRSLKILSSQQTVKGVRRHVIKVYCPPPLPPNNSYPA
jgi:hypothetical protein